MLDERLKKYWNANLRILTLLLIVWFAVSYGAGVIWADFLNQYRLFGFKLGFWFAQQGSIYLFVLIIYAYVMSMNYLDRKYGVHD